jgi:hypothetical protein
MENKENWDSILKRHIQLAHIKNGHYKTTLPVSDTLYSVVTRVNYLTAKIWFDHVNSIIRSNKALKIEPLNKINWLVMLKSYRRDFQRNLEEKLISIETNSVK